MNAVVLAAGRSGDDFQKAFGTEFKCLVEVAGRPIIHWVLDALRASSEIDRIVVIGPEQALRKAGVTEEIIPNDTGSYTDSVGVGLRAATSARVLLIAADVPLLQADALERYIGSCLRSDADACFPVVSWEGMQERLPGARKTWYELRDGRFTKGNAVVARREALLRRLDRVESLFNSRKKKQWASLICQSFMSRLVGAACTRADVEVALSGYLGLRLEAIDAAPELAVDVDEVTDVEFVSGVLSERLAVERGSIAVLAPVRLDEPRLALAAWLWRSRSFLPATWLQAARSAAARMG
jgi:GTP:adenosylcobinamide-phosphate guanylyltransferase